MKNNPLRFLAVLGVFALAACGDDDPTGVTGSLSEAEAQDLVGLIFQLGFFNSLTLGTPQAVDGLARAIETSTQTVQTTADCPAGGTVSLDATIDYSFDTETLESSIDYSVTQIHNGCMGVGGQGQTFTLNGNPSVTFSLSADANAQDTSTSWSGGMNGGVAWDVDGRSGTCTVSVEYAGSGSSSGAVSFSMNGIVCGTSFSQTYSIG